MGILARVFLTAVGLVGANDFNIFGEREGNSVSIKGKEVPNTTEASTGLVY